MVAVAVALASDGADFEQSCARCDDVSLRKQWGCDAATPEPLFFIGPCMWCSGKNEACPHCEGHNRIAMHRCPHSVATRDMIDVVQSVALTEQGILPDVGGWIDQATQWVQAFPIVSNEITRTRARKQEQAIKKQSKRR